MAETAFAAKPGDELTPGEDIGVSKWVTIDQDLIDLFSRATLDTDPMHVDPNWAKDKGPFGHTVSFGFLTMSLLTHLMHDAAQSGFSTDPDVHGYYLNYGFNRMRLIAPVPVGSRVRGKFRTISRELDEKQRHIVKFGVEIEIEGHDRLALAGEWLSVWVPPGDTTNTAQA
ncbi:MAG TPA: MaoC/PaaZ C-terminal domain-containing protein [Verrucomicrobiae bacterium]|nr:MaoC/PaaZ C-terminal domain-containing protein [Verrucomicrobiae bacterium]